MTNYWKDPEPHLARRATIGGKLLSEYRVPRGMHQQFAEYCETMGVDFICEETPAYWFFVTTENLDDDLDHDFLASQPDLGEPVGTVYDTGAVVWRKGPTTYIGFGEEMETQLKALDGARVDHFR